MSSRRSPASLTTMALLLLGVAAPALAQERGFRLHRYDGTSAGSWQFLVERPWYSGLRFGAVGVTADFSRNALVPRLATGRGDVTPIIENALLGHVDLAGSLFDRVVLSGTLPVTFLETGRTEAVSQVGPLQGVGVGDPRVGAMVRVAGQADVDPFSLHLGADLWIPVGTSSTHQGDTGFRLRPRVVMAGAFGVGRWSFEGGFLFRQYASFGPPALGMTAASEAQGGLALGVSLFNDSLFLGPESQFAMQVVGENALSLNGMNLEVLGGAHLLIADTVLLGVAGGTAFFGASGTPDLRAIARLSWAPRKSSRVTPVEPPPIDETACPENTKRTPAGCVSGDGRLMMAGPAGPGGDSDDDGIPDGADRCPFEPETKNGVRDLDGCPESAMEPDAALARVLAPQANRAPRPVLDAGLAAPPPSARVDAGVAAMNAPSMRVDAGVAPTSAPSVRVDGGVTLRTDVAVPVAADSDGDGVPDDADRCPVQKEDLDGFEDEDGCPELDDDDDGIADAMDRCPSEAETANGFEDEDGCPDLSPDADKDGIADVADRCPFEPETLDGVRDDDGCPEFQAADHVALARILSATPANVLTPSTNPDAAPVVAPPLDSDGDGVDDDADRCPVTKEDLDGFEDEDGCPEADDDDDGVADAKDRCPQDAETINGTKDDDGCPDEVSDVDKDGVGYDDDRCPLEPGNSDDGCPHLPLPDLALAGFFELPPATTAPKNAPPPPPDTVKPAEGDLDKDGTTDELDRCPLSAEDVDGFEDEDGCPEPDNDHDGIADAKDKCPFEAETINGKNDTDGCPDTGVGAVTVQENKVVINGVIGFKTASATLQPAALPLLKQVASTLLAASTISLDIQGHTDDVGNAAANIKLSKRRAEAIRAVLVKSGVSPKRLIATGFGPTRPRATNKTAAGREQNRRVEFLILGEAK